MNKLIKSKIKLINSDISNDFQALKHCINLVKEIQGTPKEVSVLFNFYKSL